MNPLPASTAMAFSAGFVTVILVWLAKTFFAVEVPEAVAQAITGLVTVAAGHFTTDKATIEAPPVDPAVSVKQ